MGGKLPAKTAMKISDFHLILKILLGVYLLHKIVNEATCNAILRKIAYDLHINKVRRHKEIFF